MRMELRDSSLSRSQVAHGEYTHGVNSDTTAKALKSNLTLELGYTLRISVKNYSLQLNQKSMLFRVFR